MLVRFDPVVVEWVRSLHERAEVVWATTWESAANLFASAVGLPPAPVGVSVERRPMSLHRLRNVAAAGWKADALAEAFANRPLVWVDDLAAEQQHRPCWRHPDDVDRTLVLVPEAHIGITAEHMAAVDRFVDRQE